jgi:hypothetical protein
MYSALFFGIKLSFLSVYLFVHSEKVVLKSELLFSTACFCSCLPIVGPYS